MENERLVRQVQFIAEIDKLKQIIRRTYLINEDRNENSAEHSWHAALMALLLAEYADEEIDIGRVIRMLLVHDIVEIDAGDTYCYSDVSNEEKLQRERKAADRIFPLLPDDQAKELRELWEEFEIRASPDAKFAAALDRVLPVIHNYYTQGRSWQEHSVTSEQVIARNIHVREGSQTLWRFVQSVIRDAVAKGYLHS